ncbi:MAG: hypothetical protein NC417_07350 [Candidatus Gastranaerophilales bacterium]|nr:hypothetical protein [Candidatus Gastranaerophilales bacterium]
MKEKRKRWSSGMLCVILAFSLLGCQNENVDVTKAEYPDKVHQEVAFEDMVFTGFDETNLEAALEELQGLSASGALEAGEEQTKERVAQLYDVIKEEMDLLSTQYCLINIQYDANGADEELAEIAADLSARSSVLSDQCYQALALLVDTPCQEIIEEEAGADNIEYLREYEPVTERMLDLLKEEEKLEQAYDQVMAQASNEDEQTTYQKAGEIYCDLVQVRAQIAEEAGYDNYVEYAYQEIYNRDYTLEDIKLVWEAVKEYIVPVEEMAMDSISERTFRSLYYQTNDSGEEILDAIGPYMRQIDPELGDTFDFMRKYHLYDIEYSDSKLNMGYTVGLPTYGTAFIFNAPYGTYQDYIDTIHEFGHFNETFHCTQHDLWANFNIDVGEIHSQGLTLLFTEYSDELFGKAGETFSRTLLWDIISTVTEGCLYDEFQAAVYQNPDMSLEEINRLYKNLSEQYGYYYAKGVEESYYWIEVSHNFQNPLYYISYATSALSSLDLWLISLEDRDEAVDIYMDLAALSLTLPYRETIEEVGLHDIFQPETIPEIAEELENCLDSGTGLRGGKAA